MGIQTKTPLTVTEVITLTGNDFIDLTLNTGQKARIKKSVLLPLASTSKDGLTSKRNTKIDFLTGPNETSLRKIIELRGTSKIDALINYGSVSGVSNLIYMSAVVHPSGTPTIKIYLIKGTISATVSFYAKVDNTNNTLDLYIKFTVGNYVRFNLTPLYNDSDSIKNEVSSEDISALTLITVE